MGNIDLADKVSIFVSKPNALSAGQTAFWHGLRQTLRERGFKPRTLGESDYPNTAPVHAVRDVLGECAGVIVLGLAQLQVHSGVLKEGSGHERDASGTLWASPWNQIEFGMAYMLDLPLLIIRETDVSGGVFETGNTDRFIHQTDTSSGWLAGESFRQPFNEWSNEVVVRSRT